MTMLIRASLLALAMGAGLTDLNGHPVMDLAPAGARALSSSSLPRIALFPTDTYPTFSVWQSSSDRWAYGYGLCIPIQEMMRRLFVPTISSLQLRLTPP